MNFSNLRSQVKERIQSRKAFRVLSRLFAVRRFNDLRIGVRLGLGFGILVVLMFAVGVTSLVIHSVSIEARNVARTIEREVFLIEHIRVELLKARRGESDFLQRHLAEGYENAFNKYILNHQEHLQNIYALLGKLRAIEVEPHEIRQLNEIEQTLRTYETLFIAVVSQIEERGSIAEGRGLVNNVIQDFESVVLASSATGTLEIEVEARHTLEDVLEYLVAPDQDTIDSFFRHSTTLAAIIRSSALMPTEKREILTLIEEGISDLDELITLDAVTAEKTDEFQMAAKSAEPLIEAFIEEERNEKAEVLRELETMESLEWTVSLISPLLAGVIGVWLAVVIGRIVITPIIHLGAVAEKVMEGDLSARARVESHDEIGILAATFNNMTAQLQKAHAELEEQIEERTQQLSESNAALRQRNQMLETLNDLSLTDQLSLETGAMLNSLVKTMAETIDATSAYICDLDEKTINATVVAEYVSPQASHLERISDLGETYDLEEKFRDRGEWLRSPSGVAISHIDDPGLDPREREHMKQYGAKTVLYVPLMIDDNPIAFIEIWESRRQRHFTQEEIALVTAIANRMAVAIHNARLYQEVYTAKEELTLLIDSANAPIFGVDTEGRLNEWNRMATRLTGFGKLEALGRNLVDVFIPAEYRDSARKVITAASIGQETTNYELTLYNKGGHVVELLMNATPRRNMAGDIIGVIGVAQDITQRKQAERALKQERSILEQRVQERTSELADANKELTIAVQHKDEFLASMSHELRTPLNAILGQTEILQEQLYGALNLNQLESLRSIETSGQHLLELINDILDAARIEAGELKLELDSVLVEKLCEDSMAFVEQTAYKKRLKVSMTCDSTAVTLQADQRRLKQILVNLLSNAVKFTPEGGSIGLEVLADAQGQAISLTVWDTGIGISAEDLPRLFKPFTQLDSRLARQYEGSGLGLALAYCMTELHGGSLSVVSELGQGSRFTVSLPWQEAVDKSAGADNCTHEKTVERQRTTAQQRLILLAEDNETNLRTVRNYLEGKGYRLALARNGVEVLERAQAERPDVILMDIQMPEMDGLEATRRIRADAKLADIPIIALTALALHGDRERCLAAGANEYLSKPVSLKGLVDVIEAQMEV